MANEKIIEAKKAYDLEVKEAGASMATAEYITLLEEENKELAKYKEWWHGSITDKTNLESDIKHLQAEVDYYRSVIAHEFNRK